MRMLLAWTLPETPGQRSAAALAVSGCGKTCFLVWGNPDTETRSPSPTPEPRGDGIGCWRAWDALSAH